MRLSWATLRALHDDGPSPEWRDRHNVAGFIGGVTNNAADRFSHLITGGFVQHIVGSLRAIGTVLMQDAVASDDDPDSAASPARDKTIVQLADFCDGLVGLEPLPTALQFVNRLESLLEGFAYSATNAAQLYVAAHDIARKSGADEETLLRKRRPWTFRDQFPEDDLTLAFEAAVEVGRIRFAHTMFDQAIQLRDPEIEMRTVESCPLGESCPVVTLAKKHFGDDLGEYLLWNETCFPFCDVTAMNQLQYLIAKDKQGEDLVLDGWVETQREEANDVTT